MILRLLGPLAAVVVGGLVAALLFLFGGLDRALVLDAYLVYAGAVALAALSRATGEATRPGGPSRFEAALRRRRPVAGRPDALLRLEGLVSLATATAGDFHHGLRPQLAAAAAHRLESRLGADPAAEPERAAEALGPEAWELLRPDRKPPADRFASGPGIGTLSRAAAAIERIEP